MIIGAERLVADEVTEVRSPFDNRLVGTVPRATAAHIDDAVRAARAAMRSPLPTFRRAEILDVAAAQLLERTEEFAQCLSAESAKPITTARTEAARAVDTTRFSAAVARTAGGELIQLDASVAGLGKVGFVRRVPRGVVGAISPFNFPLNLVCHKVMPAIAAGCAVVLKPASSTPLTALLLAEMLLTEAGLPPGWLNVVTAPGSVANRLVDHEDVAMITFTGSPEVGWGIRARVPHKKVSLELGNNSPVIIAEDADLALAAKKLRVGGFAFAGQSCISSQRIYVHTEVADRFRELLAAEVASLVVGDPSDPEVEVSALIDPGETERVAGWIDEATAAGAELVVGGKRTADGVLEPTLLNGITPDMKVSSNEVFGPVLGIATYDDFEAALAAANASRYGLQAGVFTADIGRALRAAEALDFGGVIINEVPTWRADQMPYGGLRDSGNTREGPAYAVHEMTEERLIVIQH
jgi:acyl-CoA reductase-like NAD-dependent aldehyde dehydrogenase